MYFLSPSSKCKLAAILVRFVAEHAQNLMQLGGAFWETAGNIALDSENNCNEIASSLHLRQKLHWKARQKSHVNGPQEYFKTLEVRLKGLQ